MQIFLVLVFIAAGIAVLATLAMGLVNLTKMSSADLMGTGDAPTERALKSNKLMRQRILFQGIGIGVLALILLAASASGS
ncbi:HIG1 domain-containing protein [Sphingomonas sp.]|uniref:HIG1 domain-containing protein n=1 Tax=Sphingomonas sp. TaxID=28214 RepID=UPI001B0F0442|nr:HIG1 domain-containing protein [Sphingomonas sp.]MBO9713032.1 HIG1 domain-containing protein [Sphingomonas sp.]